MEKKNIWLTSDILANRNNWSLAADVELLKHLQALSEKIFSKTASTLQSLNSFENDINQICISVANTSNKFKALSDTQFIESKVQEESSDINESSGSQIEPPADRGNENITVKLKEALENGFQVLDTQYDIIPVTGSDDEDEGPQEILLRARNPYLIRRLPHIIGSEEFTRNDNLGLIDSSSEEEDEEEEEDENTEDDDEERKEDHDDLDEDSRSTTIRKSPSPKSELVRTPIEFVRPRTEIIRISSSDSEDSELSNPYDEYRKQEKVISTYNTKSTEKSKDNEPIQNSNSFAERLSAALKNNPHNTSVYNIVPPDFGDTPPPFPGKDNCVSSDNGSEDSDDLFSTKKSTKHSISNTIYKSNYDNESDEDDFSHIKKTAVISQEPDASGKTPGSRKVSIASKTSQHSDSIISSSVVDETPAKDVTITPKTKFADTNVNSINKKMASVISAELSAKLNLKSPSIKSMENIKSAPTSTKSSEIHTPVEISAKPSENNTPTKTSKPKAASEQTPSTSTKNDSKTPAFFDKLDDENDNEDDLFSGISNAKKTTSKGKKSTGLFDDDDSIDNLFSPVKSAQSSSKKSDDLFSSAFDEPTKPENTVNESTAQPPVVDLFKNSNLFASDSDSEDDIFSIIKGQKKPATDIFKTKTDSLFENNPRDSVETLIPSNDTQSTKTSIFDPVIKSNPSEFKSSSLTEEKLQSGNLKTSTKLADSAKPSIVETNVSVDVAKSSKNNLFESTHEKKTAGNLFYSDDDDDDDDLFSKSNISAYERPSINKNTNVLKTEVPSSTNIKGNIAEKKTAAEIRNNIHRDSSGESVDREENADSQKVKNIAQPDKTINIFAQLQSPVDVCRTSENDENETEATSLQNKDDVFNESSIKNTEDIGTVSPQKDDIFRNYGDFSTNSEDSKDEDMFGESYGSRSAMYLPPKDDSSDDFFEDEDIKGVNYLSQEDEDLFDEKLGSPPFHDVIPDDNDIFGEKGSSGIDQESPKNSVITDTTPVEDLFAKSTDSLPTVNLFARNSLFGEQIYDLKGNEKLAGKIAGEKLNLNPEHENQSKKDGGEIAKNDSIQKLPVLDEEKIHPTSIPPFSESNDERSDAQKESKLFNFNDKDVYESESDIFGVTCVKKEKPILVTDNDTESEKSEQNNSEKISSTDDLQDQSKKSDENLQDGRVNEKISASSKIGKISTSLFERTNTEKRQGEDLHDGNLFAKSASPEPVSSTRNVPGKLAMGRGLNINVSALLPGGNWSSKMKQKQSTEQVTPDEKQFAESAIVKESQNADEQATGGLLNNVVKERPKLSSKRRPPSRKARRSRILNNDVFGSEFETESLQEEDKSNVRDDSPKIQGKVEVEKSVKVEKTVDGLFADSEDKMDDFFGISKISEEFNIKQSGAVSNSQVSNVSSSREVGDNDLNLDISSSLNPLLSLTKSRAKPQKRPSAFKKPSDIPPDISDRKITSSEPKSKPIIEKCEVVDKTSIPANPSKTELPSTITKSIFDNSEDDDDDLFEIVKSKKNIEEKPSRQITVEKSTAKTEGRVEKKTESKPSQQEPTPKHTAVKNTKIDIFDDDDDDGIFASAKKKLPANKLSKKSSLFEDNDDDDLFGNKSSIPSRKTSVPDPMASVTKTKVSKEKPRIVKLRSETVQKDPLTGEDITGPL